MGSISNERGTSLIGVVVAAGVMGVISMHMLQMMTQMQSQTLQMEAAIETLNLEAALVRTIQDSEMCANSLKTTTATSGQMTAGLPIAFQFSGNPRRLENNQVHGRVRIVDLRFISAGTQALTGGRMAHNGRLEFATENISNGLRFRPRTIEPVTLVVQGNSIKGCGIDPQLAANPGNPIGSLAGLNCPPNEVIAGFNTDGTLSCQKIASSSGGGSTGSVCPPGMIYCPGEGRCSTGRCQ